MMTPKTVLVLLALGASVQAGTKYDNVFPMPEPNVTHALLPNGIPSPRITGGVESVPHSKPYQAGLFLPTPQGLLFCGGSLITRQTVLTAAHCVDNLVGPVEVVLGAHKIFEFEPTQLRIESNNIIIHPNWDSNTILNDIALIILPHPLVVNDYINLIMLAPYPADFTGVQAIISGWGRDSDQSQTISPVLREVDVPIIANSVCNISYLGSIQETHICVSGLGGRSSCNGDSGGPLVFNGLQIGIVSFGIKLGCEVGWPSVYTNSTNYLDWIRTSIDDNSAT